jgi:hypothetical protein
MQILTSGSFVNLENQERVGQPIFTAKAIADSAFETDGFVSEDENNKRLALEIRQGAEYMTREHERARVQSIFAGNFLDRLREIAPAPTATIETHALQNPVAEIEFRKDEFLGFVTAAENESEEIAETVAETEITLEPERTTNESAPTSEAAESLEREASEAAAASPPETPEIEFAESQKVETVELLSAATKMKPPKPNRRLKKAINRQSKRSSSPRKSRIALTIVR